MTTEAAAPRTFVQWKGTDLCMDLMCPCGCDSHIDGMFAYYVECPSCHAIYEMPTQIPLKRVSSLPDGDEAVKGV